MSTPFTYLITDSQKSCQAAEEISSKNYHIILNIVYTRIIMGIPKLDECQFHLQVVDYNVSKGAVLQHPLYIEGLQCKRTT
jgi:hypothetical protein